MAKLTVDIYDGFGKKIGEVPMGQQGITGESTNDGYQKVYQATDEQGNRYYTPSIVQADSSITIDKKTGDINISAPKEVLQDPSFKEVFSSDVLKQLSSAYKRNPDYKIADPFDESDEAKDITIPEVIEKYSESMKDFVAAMQQEKKTRTDVASGQQGYSNRNNIANRLTRDDMIIMGTNAMGEGANDNSLISIPKFMFEDVNFLESFDPESGTVKRGDFTENAFSLIKKDEAYINSLHNKLEEYFENDDFDDTEEYARATALRSFITNNYPAKTPGQDINYVVSSWFKGAGYGLNKTVGQSADAFLGASPEYLEEEYKDEDAYIAEAEKFLSRMSEAGSNALGVGKIVGSLGAIIPLSIATGGAAGELAATATAARTIGSALTTTKNVETTASSIAAAAEELTVGADMLIAANNANRAAQIGSAAARLSQYASRIGTAVDLATQSITEAVMSDPVVFAKILQNQQSSGVQASTSDDAYGLLLETAAWNIGGWGAFTVGAKAVKSFRSTKAGRYTNAIAQKYLNKVPVYTGNIGEKILKLRYGDDWLNGSRSARKNEARKYNYELRQAQKDIASQKIGLPFSKSAAANVKKQEENIINMMALHNATDAVQRGANAYIRRMLNSNINPTLAGYEQKLRALGAKITKAERKAGLSTRRKIFRREDTGVVRVFSKESANYIGARTQLDILENIKRIRGGLTDAQKKSEEILKKKLADAKAKLPEEIQEGLEAYLAWDRKFWQEYNNLRIAEGSLNARQIEELRAEGYWGENGELYRPSYRVDPDKETKLVRNDDRVARDNDTATEQYVWGSEKDFMDPEVARYMTMGDAGSTLNATKYIEALNAMPSSKAHVVYDAEEVARAQRMKEISKPLGKRIKDVTRDIFKTGAIATGGSAMRASRLYKMRADWIKQAGKTEEAELKLVRASTKKIKPTVTEKRSAIGAMNQAQLDDVFSEVGISFDFNKMGSEEEFTTFYNSLDKTTQKYVQQKMGNVAGILYPIEKESILERAVSGVDYSKPLIKNAPYITAENYNKLAQMDSSFVPNLKKSLVQNRVDLRDSESVVKAAEEAKRAQLVAEREGLYKENLVALNRMTKNGLSVKDEDVILAEFDEGINEYLDLVYSDKKVSQTIDDIIVQSGTVDKEAAREYIVLEELLRDDTKELRDIRQAARDDLRGEPEKEKISDMFERMFEDKVYERRNIARQKLADEGSTLVDRKSWLEEIRKLDKDITESLAEPGYVSVPNARGEMEVWEIDPIAADLYKYAVRRPEMNIVAKFFNETSKIFRLGTTGLNLMSFVNQSFRDFGNLWLTSGSYHLVDLSRADMVHLIGPEIANWYRREEPEVYKQLLELAERQGKSIESMTVERELAIGRETSTQATETALLKTVGDASAIRKINKGEISRTNQAIDRIVDKLSTPNEWRERYFRNIVYADSLNQSLKRGYTLKQARTQAEFMMNNATTNFSRQLVHLQAWQRTVPYIGAAVNGTKSFFRILSVDPVGVISRLVGGFIIPVMAFTGLALADSEARKKYEQLSEYEKDNNLIIPVNGSLLKIPVPQEIGPLIKPWQHLVEKMYGSNRHDFWELMLNDALGISPMDITGFYDLDQDAMENPTIWDRMGNGVTQLVVGQMAPIPIKASYMLATGKDPYTGKFIDTSYQYYDSESGEVIPMDSSQSAFGQMMANVFGGSASVAAAVTTSLLGRTGIDILDALTSMGQYAATGGEEGSLETLLGRAGEAISKPITVADYDRTKAAWNREISARYREKEAILNSEKYQRIEQAINQETDPQKRKSLKAQRQDMLEDWYERVKTNINKLQDNFGGTIDRYRMASLISLLNMYESSGGISAQGRSANDKLSSEGRNEAIRTLIDMGANATGDTSILGYITRVRQKDGSYIDEIKFYKPLEILAMQNVWYGNASASASYIEELLENGPIDYKARKKAVKQQIDAIYNKGKLSKDDYNAINAIKIKWNSEVMQAIAPYIERVTPESAINDDEVIQYLKQYIYVPDDIKVDKRGYHVTNKSLAGGSANDAYIKKFLQSAYGINDTGYSGGINYSGRKTLGGE